MSSKLAVRISLTTWAAIVKCIIQRYPKIFSWLRKANCRVTYNKRIRERYIIRNPGCIYDQSVLPSCRHLVQFVVGQPRSTVMHGTLAWTEWVNQAVVAGQISATKMESSANEWWRTDRVAVDNIREGCSVQDKKNRAQNRSLWDSIEDGRWGRATVVDSNNNNNNNNNEL